MNRAPKYCVLLNVLTLLVLNSFAGFQTASATGNQITLEELGVLQLAAHDLFNVDRGDRVHANTATDFENGKLDLSTLFIDMTTGTPFSLSEIAQGGEPRNRENIILFSVAARIGQNYVDNINMGDSQQTARQKTLNEYHTLFNTAYQSAFGESVPPNQYGCVTMTENLAFRTVHDFLPGNILLDRNGDMSVVPPDVADEPKVKTLDFTPPFDNPADNPIGHTGSLTFELLQLTSDLNGDFDTEFNAINIFIPPSTNIVVDLEAADSDFADQFNTDFSFEHFLAELEDGSYDPNDDVMKQIRSLIAKGYGQGCYIGGEIIPIDSAALLVAGLQSSYSILTALVAVGSVSFGVLYSISKRR